jgi:AsmA protein
MKRAWKILFIILSCLIIIMVGMAGAIYLLVDPNDYRDEITDMVKARTGRDLLMEGDIRLVLFPRIGLALNHVSLSGNPPFEKKPFFKASRINLSVRLLPLLRERLELTRLSIEDLDLNLLRNAHGHANWSFGQPGARKGGEKKSGPPALMAVAVGGVEIRNGSIILDDRQTDRRIRILDLSVISGGYRPGAPVDLEGAFRFESTAPGMKGDLMFSSTVTMDPPAWKYRVAGTRLTLRSRGASLPGGRLNLELAFDLEADLPRQKIRLALTRLSSYGIDAAGEIRTRGFLLAPQIVGRLSIKADNPRKSMEDLGLGHLIPRDPEAFQKGSLDLDLYADLKKAELSNLSLRLDRSLVQGNIQFPRLFEPELTMDLKADILDLDPYLSTKGGSTNQGHPQARDQKPETGSGDSLSFIRQARMDARLEVEKLTVAKIDFQKVLLRIRAEDGVVDARPVRADLHGGSLEASARADAGGTPAALAFKLNARGIPTGPVIKALLGKKRMTGKGDVEADLTSKGLTRREITDNLNGRASFQVLDGELTFFGVPDEKAAGPEPDLFGEDRGTPFSSLSGTIRAVDGRLSNNDLALESTILKVRGAGIVDLPKERLDYVAEVILPLLPDLSLRISGPLRDLDIRTQPLKMLQNSIESLGKEAVDLPENVGKGVKGIGKGVIDLPENLGGAVKKLFK